MFFPKSQKRSLVFKMKLMHRLIIGEDISSLSLSFGISKQTLYRWLRRYRDSGSMEVSSIEDRYRRRYDHWKKIPRLIEKKVLKVCLRHPDLGPAKISEIFGELYPSLPKISAHGAYRIIRQFGISTRAKRQSSAENYGISLVPSPDRKEKQRMIRDHRWGEPVTSICHRIGVSRPTFYKWYRRFVKSGPEGQWDALAHRRASGESHWRYQEFPREKILE